MKYLLIALIMMTGSVKLNAQQLASEKPVASHYSKITKKQMDTKVIASKPAAARSRQVLASDKPAPQPSVPGYKPAVVKSNRQTVQKTASEKPVDMKRINRERSQKSRLPH